MRKAIGAQEADDLPEPFAKLRAYVPIALPDKQPRSPTDMSSLPFSPWYASPRKLGWKIDR